jgi:hypothetical protein
VDHDVVAELEGGLSGPGVEPHLLLLLLSEDRLLSDQPAGPPPNLHNSIT